MGSLPQVEKHIGPLITRCFDNAHYQFFPTLPCTLLSHSINMYQVLLHVTERWQQGNVIKWHAVTLSEIVSAMRIQRLSAEIKLESENSMTFKLKPKRIGVSQRKEGSR